MDVQSSSPQAGVPSVRPITGKSDNGRTRRVILFLIVGVALICGAFALRRSNWARERAFKNLNADELALVVLESPNDPLARVYLGGELLKDKRFEEAGMQFDRAIALDPKNVYAHFGLASACLNTRRVKTAIDEFETATKLNPDFVDAYVGLARAYNAAGSFKRAIPSLKRVTELQPKNAAAWHALGEMYGNSQQSDLAIEAVRKATQLDPKEPSYWRALGRLSQHYSRFEEAKEQYMHCLRLDHNDATAYLWLGQLYMEMGDTPILRGSAEATLTRAVSRVPDMIEGYFALGQLYERGGIWDLAVLNFRKAHELNRSDDQTLYHLGACMVRMGKKEEGNKLIAASKELSTAVRGVREIENRCVMEPNNREIRLRLARMHRKYGNVDGAKQRYMEYMKMGPEDTAVMREILNYQKELDKEAADEAAKAAAEKAAQNRKQSSIAQP